MSLVWGVFLLSLVVQLFYYLKVFSSIASQSDSESSNASPEPVSVIICARNEEQNLRTNLPKICQQAYPEFEVLVIVDRSSDNSVSVLRELSERFSNLQFLEHWDEKALGKKAALKFGIENSKHENLVLTDADCVPISKYWIAETAKRFSHETEIVLGFGAYEKTKGFLNAFIQYETYLTALQYFSWSLAGNTYMGVGRNLAYRKSTFLTSKQFKDSEHIASGDDDLLVQQMANQKNTAINLSPDAFTVSKAPQSLSEWWQQKARHLSTGTSYSSPVKWRLGLFSLSLCLFYLCGTVLLIQNFSSNMTASAVVVGLFSLRWLTMLIIQSRNERYLPFRNKFALLPILDCCFFAYLVVFAPLLFYRPNKKSWNKKWIDSYN